MQTHISYLGLVGGLVVVAGRRARIRARTGDAAIRRRCRSLLEVDAASRSRRRRAVDPAGHRPDRAHARQPHGDHTDYFSNPPDPPIGLHRGVDVLLPQLNPWKLVTPDPRARRATATEVEGSRASRRARCSLAFGGVGVVAWRRLRHRAVLAARRRARRRAGARARVVGAHLRIRLVLPAAVGVGARRAHAVRDRLDRRRAVSRGRTTACRASARWARGPRRAHARRSRRIVFAVEAADVTVQTPRLNETLGALVRPTANASRSSRQRRRRRPVPRDVVARPGSDRIAGLRPAERARPARVRRARRAVVPPGRDPLPRHRSDRRPTLEVHLATGPDIARWRNDSRVRRGRELRPAHGCRACGVRPVARRGRRASSRRPGSAISCRRSTTTSSCSGIAPNVPERDARADEPDARRSGCRRRCSSARQERTAGDDEKSPPRLGVRSLRRRSRVGALAVRVAYVLKERRDFEPGGDAFFYHAGANLLADGKGFISPFFYPARHVQAAEHPPLYTMYLAVPSLFGMHSVLTHCCGRACSAPQPWCSSGCSGRAVARRHGRHRRGRPRRAVPEHLGARRHAAGRDARRCSR